MTVEKILCDECGRVKGDANHWHQIGVVVAKGFEEEDGTPRVRRITVEAGHLAFPREGAASYECHDLCGELCFHKHIAKLLGFNPMPEGQ